MGLYICSFTKTERRKENKKGDEKMKLCNKPKGHIVRQVNDSDIIYDITRRGRYYYISQGKEVLLIYTGSKPVDKYQMTEIMDLIIKRRYRGNEFKALDDLYHNKGAISKFFHS